MNFLKLSFVSIVVFLAACAPKTAAPPLFEERSLEEAMARRSGIGQIDATFSVIFEKADAEMRGEGALNVFNNGDLELRVYSLGFLAMELTSRSGVVKSSPLLDSAKKAILTQGLRDSLFWWDIEDFTLEEEGGHYLLKNTQREILVDKKSMLPVKQLIYFSNGRVLTVYYDNPAQEDGIVYQSRMRIELPRYAVTLVVKTIRFSALRDATYRFPDPPRLS